MGQSTLYFPGHKENKIAKAGVHVTRSQFVDAPIIDEYPLTLECKVVEMREALGEMHVVGEVVNVLADESVLDGQGKVDLSRLRPISYDSVSHSYRILDNIVGKASGEELLHRLFCICSRLRQETVYRYLTCRNSLSGRNRCR